MNELEHTQRKDIVCPAIFLKSVGVVAFVTVEDKEAINTNTLYE